MVHQSTKVGRQLQKLEPTVALQVHPPLPANRVGGCWGNSSSQWPVSLDTIVAEHARMPMRQRRRESKDDTRYTVPSPSIPRASARPAEGNECSVFGCYASTRNVCQATLDPHERQGFQRHASALSAWCNSLEPAVADGACAVLWLRGESAGATGEASRRCDMSVLLAGRRKRPQMQFFCRLVLRDRPNDPQCIFPEVFPYVLRLAERSSRLSANFKSLDLCTSDELCLRMSRLGMTSWALVPLDARPLPSDTLLDFEITGAGAEFHWNARRRLSTPLHFAGPTECRSWRRFGHLASARRLGATS